MIRKMRKSDLKEIVEIEQRCFKNPWNMKQYEYELYDNPYSNLWVLEEDGRIIVFYDLWIMFDNADIANIAVDTPYQKKGYGRQLMNHLENQAVNKGCENIGLEVRVSNEAAIKLYERHGFSIINTRVNYYKDEDGYRMMKGI